MAVVISTPLFYDNIHHVAVNIDKNDANDDENDDDTCDANVYGEQIQMLQF